MPDATEWYARAARRAIDVMAAVPDERWGDPTPCQEWTVQDLADHLAAGAEYLSAACNGTQPREVTGTTAARYRVAVDECLAALREPGVLERACVSPLGFEWTVADAAAGIFMDTLVHTWDLARATGQDSNLDPALVEACVATFLPHMPEMGRQSGLVGAAVDVGPGASAQDRLLGAMGRTP